MGDQAEETPPVRLAHDPAEYLDSARQAIEDIARDEDGTEESIALGLAHAQAWATMATAAAMLQPTPEEVISIYRETTDEVLGEEAQKVARARQILQDAIRHGPRHPGLHAALEALGPDDG